MKIPIILIKRTRSTSSDRSNENIWRNPYHLTFPLRYALLLCIDEPFYYRQQTYFSMLLIISLLFLLRAEIMLISSLFQNQISSIPHVCTLLKLIHTITHSISLDTSIVQNAQNLCEKESLLCSIERLCYFILLLHMSLRSFHNVLKVGNDVHQHIQTHTQFYELKLFQKQFYVLAIMATSSVRVCERRIEVSRVQR